MIQCLAIKKYIILSQNHAMLTISPNIFGIPEYTANNNPKTNNNNKSYPSNNHYSLFSRNLHTYSRT